MEMTMTLSHLADLIIVISFFSICGAGAGYILFQLIDLIFDGIKAIQKKRKERKEKMSEKPEEDKTE
mgnify:CR=1 FL=1